ERLLALVVRDGILRATDEQPLVRQDGTTGPWMLDSLGVSLSAEGNALAAECLARLLDGFEGRQLATFGTSGIPLVTGIVARSGGRYRGLLVRKEVKAYGARKRIEGHVSPGEPVIIVDDSIVGGYSSLTCADHLEQAGLVVEGVICLVS